MIPALTCRDMVPLITDYLEHSLPWSQQTRFQRHLHRCPECRTLLDELQLLPEAIRPFSLAQNEALAVVADKALAYALEHFHEPWVRPFAGGPVPDSVQRMLAQAADLPLRLMAKARAAMVEGFRPESEPFLPEGVLAELPPAQTWEWSRVRDGICKAVLWSSGDALSLNLLFMPPHHTLADHVHEGSESLLVLAGELESGSQCLSDGDWIHLESGSSHAPHAFHRGCWCLVREEGPMRFTGAWHWRRNRAGAA